MLSRRAWILASVLALGCGEDRAADEPEPPAPPAPSADVDSPAEPAEAAPRSTLAADRDAAGDAYRAMVTAYNERDREAYFSRFASELRCFYGREGVSRETVERQRWGDGAPGRLAVAKLTLIKHAPDEVVLLDRGFFEFEVGPGGRQVLHEKIVVLHRQAGQWLVVAETNRDGLGCLGVELDLSVRDSTEFEGCRRTHRACIRACGDSGCRADCRDDALACLHLRAPPAVVHSTAGPAVALGSDSDVRRFVTLALESQLSQTSGGHVVGAPELDAGAQRWLHAAYAGLGAPRIRRERVGEPGARCGHALLTFMNAMDFDEVTVEDVTCASDRSRCVVTGAAAGQSASRGGFVMQLLFDGGSLRVAQTRAFAGEAPDAATELQRYATERPASWTTTCSDGVEALAEDRVGEDFWHLESGAYIEGMDGSSVRATRLCGADAARAVAALGDEWECGATGCAAPYMCGNYCAGLTLEGGRLLAHNEGIEPLASLSPQARDALRERIACGASGGLSDTEAGLD